MSTTLVRLTSYIHHRTQRPVLSLTESRTPTSMARRTTKAKPAKTLEQTLWEAADKLRGNQEPSEYKHVVLGLVFL
ncbi:type I restriction-modification system subunit M N-terminal domain-containing protein, partial [Corynebacterium variabile]|uniref:type I restriction-modification system subunit M N-terminal domain-containing protein n=1 Tax=Corynebacterium variabile TaxID=1727 RepID=UPI003BB1283F